MISSSDRIFKDLVENTRLGQDKELVSLLRHNQNARTPLYEEVQSLIRELNLVEYKVAQQIGSNVENSINQEIDGSAPRKPPLAVDEKTQRRLSYEIRNLTRSETSRNRTASAPAVPTVSNFSVNSKVTNLANQDYTPVPYVAAPKGSIKKALEKYNPGLKSGNARSPHRRTASSQTVKASRRSSLVGEVLPEYIRQQLVIDKSPSPGGPIESDEERPLESVKVEVPKRNSDIASALAASKVLNSNVGGEDGKSASGLITSTLRREGESSQSNRFKNVLVNSQSLYVRKDDSTSASQEGLESGVSETDKEYISPSSFTRSIEDFGGPDVLLYNHSEEEEEDEVGDEEDGDDDDYLF